MSSLDTPNIVLPIWRLSPGRRSSAAEANLGDRPLLAGVYENL